jgi:uncharacterized protein (TIGR01777 family)
LRAVRVAITGSSGLIGTALRSRLIAEGHEVVRVVRGDPADGDISWDPMAGRLEAADLDGVDAVVNLAGAGIGDKRWTDEYKRQIRDSRVLGTTLLSTAIARAAHGPRILLSGSAIGLYGDRGSEELDETSPPGEGFLAAVTEEWEAATAAASEAGVRVAHLRTGIVLSRAGGALKKQLPLFKLGLGGRFGSGAQWQSWISIDDEVGAILHLLAGDVTGPVNLTAPNPVTNAEFASVLARVLHRPSLVPVPRFGPTLILGGELTDTLLYEGQRVLPRVLLADDYTFAHADLDAALRALLGR